MSVDVRIDSRIKDVFADVFQTSADHIDDDVSTATLEGWDSMQSIVLAHTLEETFGVEFTDRELMLLDSFANVRALLLRKGVS